MIARYYNATHGVFLSMDPDPVDDDDILTQNGYTYANNNPVMLVDPDGHYVQIIVYGGIAAYSGYKLYKGYKTYKKIKNVSKLAKVNKKGPGTYVVKYKNGNKYIGKGNVQRSRASAKRYATKNNPVKSVL